MNKPQKFYLKTRTKKQADLLEVEIRKLLKWFKGAELHRNWDPDTITDFANKDAARMKKTIAAAILHPFAWQDLG